MRKRYSSATYGLSPYVGRVVCNSYRKICEIVCNYICQTVGGVMGSESDWKTMQKSVDILTKFDIPYEVLVVSAHRTPDRLFEYAADARARGLRVIIAGAGGAAHLPGMLASKSVVQFRRTGRDKLFKWSGFPFFDCSNAKRCSCGYFAIGDTGAFNAALEAVAFCCKR